MIFAWPAFSFFPAAERARIGNSFIRTSRGLLQKVVQREMMQSIDEVRQ